jgi:hypothetical protein
MAFFPFLYPLGRKAQGDLLEISKRIPTEFPLYCGQFC